MTSRAVAAEAAIPAISSEGCKRWVHEKDKVWQYLTNITEAGMQFIEYLHRKLSSFSGIKKLVCITVDFALTASDKKTPVLLRTMLAV